MSSQPQPSNGTVDYSVERDPVGDVATVTLNRPETLNSMNDEFMNDITEAFGMVAADDGVRAVILTGEGRGFCSGADLRNAAAGDAEGFDADAAGEATTDSMDNVFHPAIRAVAECPVPTVARINGVTAGGGIGLALSCDVAIAARSAFFVATFGPRLGIVPDLGTTWQLPMRVGRARALGMALLGERVTADQAEDWGLVWKTVDDEELDSAVGQVVDVLRRSSPAAMSRIRETVDGATQRDLTDQLDVEMGHQAVLIPRNMADGAAAFLAKSDPSFSGDRY
ncbi:enoyl-CoA hydratase/isomerase family protein [Candidatus Poriferisodalis sp.]|uniref:enoyl-CoA hydratase/isomerase family protein n=1 Tax=Candidatus Poriferisodalis sp. TaxID=3101277 RepID=UPI003B015B4E